MSTIDQIRTKSLKKLRRARKGQGRVVAGVAQGMAEYLDIDVTVVRLVWVLLLLPGGFSGIVPYVICWLVIPEM